MGTVKSGVLYKEGLIDIQERWSDKSGPVSLSLVESAGRKKRCLTPAFARGERYSASTQVRMRGDWSLSGSWHSEGAVADNPRGLFDIEI
jgi:hypothetical protein